ncbi:hypothetical protein NDU88_003368 [Pleurodeles waltl]|uniref:Uncharacterized protein n=1 Tax=Pleurodeles waltl TaxID=8319 RepID=A0AAV7T529_PLEWA|nr:hypothetical protein NDU88_003368 [Pleurodeles waltl]
MGLEHRMATMEAHIQTVQNRDQDLMYLRSKLTALEDRSCRDNVHFFGFPEHAEVPGTQSFFRSVLPKLTDLTFVPPLEFQQVHELGPRPQDGTSRPRPIIACLLRYGQTCQLLPAAWVHGPFRAEGYKIRITADYSKETNEHRKAFKALRPRLHQLEVKYGLFEPARLWVTKNGVSKEYQEYQKTSRNLRICDFSSIVYSPKPWTHQL